MGEHQANARELKATDGLLFVIGRMFFSGERFTQADEVKAPIYRLQYRWFLGRKFGRTRQTRYP